MDKVSHPGLQALQRHAPQFIQTREVMERCNVPVRRVEYNLTNISHGNQLCIKI